MDGNVVFENASSELGRQVKAPADRKPSGSRGSARRPHEVTPRNAIAVQEHEQLRIARERPEISSPGSAKAFVRVPEVRQPRTEASLPALDDEGGRGAGAVVGDDDLEVRLRLLGETPQHCIESLGPFVRADDDRQPTRGP